MSQKQCKAWTVQEWQQAYQRQYCQLDDLIEYVAAFDPTDPAWICIVSTAQLQQQIRQLKIWAAQTNDVLTALPLYGVPFAVKDNIDVAGFASTAACVVLDQIAEKDAFVIDRLKRAGAIMVGKTNLDQFATGLVGTRCSSVVPNSFNPDYICGGSSSGSASVVARGLVPFALGTDTAGSGRIPAAFNNIVGLKPSKGRFSNRGLFPACKSLDCISIFALTVVDADAVALLITAYDELDDYSRVNPHTAPARFSSPVHLAIPNVLNFYGDIYAEAAFHHVIAELKLLGVHITKIDFSPFEQLAQQLYQGAWLAERTTSVESVLMRSPEAFDPTVRRIIEKGYDYSAMEAYQAEYLRRNLSTQIAHVLADFDALCVPTAATIYRINQVMENPIELNAYLGTYTNFTNLADLSAIALPAAFRADGLPFGISLIAPAWHDQALAHFGKIWQQHIGLSLGALNKKNLVSTISSCPPPMTAHVRVAVVGAHLREMPLNFQLTDRHAVYLESTNTQRCYALYALNSSLPAKPGLVRVAEDGQSICVELWDIPTARFGEFVAEIPAPLVIGNIELIDGRVVKGFLCESHALNDAIDISQFGGWRDYLHALDHATDPASTAQKHG